MADDDRSSSNKPKKSDSTLKIVLIVFGSIAAIGVLSCCGIFGAGYFWIQKNLGQAMLTNAADIQKLTAEMTDITIPPEFVPKEGHSIFGIKSVDYEWCPTGSCPPRTDGLGKLSLSSINLGDASKTGPAMDSLNDSEFSDEMLKHQWKNFTKSEHEFTIRGKKCKFYIVQGEQLNHFMDDDEDEDAMPAATISKSDDPDAEKTDADEPAATSEEPTQPPQQPAVHDAGPKSVEISGTFPGKEAECKLEIRLSAEEYNEEKILTLLRSIR